MTRFNLDASPASGILVNCADCPFWHAFAWTRSDAWDAARRHELDNHPGATEATTRRAWYSSSRTR